MKQIRKNREPDSLTQYRQQQDATYEGYPDKGTLRGCLHKEQKGICCYCMSRIKAEALKMKIEHFQCQERYSDKQLDYSNMLGACLGNEGSKNADQHCDTFKGNKDLTLNPSEPFRLPINNTIEYKNDGTISSTDESLDNELNQVLNLNVKKLVNARKGVLDGFKDSIHKIKGKKVLQKNTLESWKSVWEGNNTEDELRPYCMVVVYWIDKRLRKS